MLEALAERQKPYSSTSEDHHIFYSFRKKAEMLLFLKKNLQFIHILFCNAITFNTANLILHIIICNEMFLPYLYQLINVDINNQYRFQYCSIGAPLDFL